MVYAIAAVLGLVIASAFYMLWTQDYFYTFPRDKFGIAVAGLLTKDIAGGTSDHPESFVSHQDLEKVIGEFLPANGFAVRTFGEVLRSHDEAVRWGRRRKASVVIWGSADRGTEWAMSRARSHC